MSEEQDQLIRTRSSTKATITKIKTYADKFPEDGILEELHIRNEKLEQLWEKYDYIQTKLEAIHFENYANDRDTTEESYFSAKAAIAKMLNKRVQKSTSQAFEPRNAGAPRSSEAAHTAGYVKLPQLNIPTFSGSYQNWQGFHDVFTSLIHNNKEISEVQKFYYLKSSLKGEALKIIEAIAVSSDNYVVAWDLLVERYDIKDFIVNSHIQAVFDIPPVTKDVASSLRNVITEVKQHLRSLKSLGLPTEQWDALMLHIVMQKLDSQCRRDWELSKNTKIGTLSTLNELYAFLERRCLSLEAIGYSEKIKPKTTHVAVEAQNTVACKLCKNQHNLWNCEKLLKQTASERIKTIKSLGVCFNCLKSSHSAYQCKSTYTCKKCRKRHHTLIHLDSYQQAPHNSQHTEEKRSNQQSQQGPSTNTPSGGDSDNPLSLISLGRLSEVLLATAVIKVRDGKGTWQTCRTLLDSASQTNFITQELMQRLNFKPFHKNLSVSGINQVQTHINKSVKICIASRISQFNKKMEFFVMSKITNELPMLNFETADWNIPQNVVLADPEFNNPAPIEMLLGAEIYFNILKNHQVRLGRNLPIMQNTEFGYILSGKAETTTNQAHSFLTIEDLSKQVTEFWRIEDNTDAPKILSSEEIECEQHFIANTKKNEENKFIVRLPFKIHPEELGESYTTALKRFHHLENKFNRNEDLKRQYSEFLNEYLELGHMKEVTSDANSGYYMPHHAILKDSSLTTKIRVVFDASAESTSGLSLNDILTVGPTIQEDLFAILTRFRMHQYVLTADIEKMYRMILIHDEDRKYQKILWRSTPDQEIKTYELQTVTYGTATAPFLAVRCLLKLAEDEAARYPLASVVAKRDFYVDDVLTGGSSIQELVTIRDELTQLLRQGGFQLRKWLSNDARVLENIQKSEDPFLLLDISQTTKTLGVQWNAQEDCIIYNIQNPEKPVILTKRTLLSQIARLFDPLGLLGPIISMAKMIMQELWQSKINWDEPVTTSIKEKWDIFCKQLESLQSIKIPRRVVIENSTELQIHGFCDASEKAYGACIYIRSMNANNGSTVQLLCSKSRVAPLKKLSIPRLELCAAVLLANLYTAVTKALKVFITKTYLWSDSTIVICWINTLPHKLKTFVGNRAAEIQKLTNSGDWRHISSTDNPADIISRGCFLDQLKQEELWWTGPHWLAANEEQWPVNNNIIDIPEHVYEFKPSAVTCHSTVQQCDLFQRYSKLHTLQRIVAYCFRFIHNLRNNQIKSSGPLTVRELNKSLLFLIKQAQLESLAPDITYLKRYNHVDSKSSLKSLNPFLDENEIKHQIILPTNHVLTRLIVEQEHIRNLHAGTQSLLNSIRQRYWPIKGRKLIKQVIHKCQRCFRLSVAPMQQTQLMGNLPSVRTEITRPFLNVGVDYGGPLLLKQGSQRKPSITKAYIALFVCMSTKAIHLELVSSLSTEAFLSALRRFSGRRGKALNIYSDNATNFKGAHNELKELQRFIENEDNKARITTSASLEDIQWHFIPPNSPNFGGLWEAGIKCVKFHIKRVVGEAKLTFEEMCTLLVQIEGCINSRPLTPIYDDPTDLTPLSPAHFLIGTPLTQVPDEKLLEVPCNRLSRWQLIQKMVQHFWKRWSSEYLHHLQQRVKWTHKSLT